MRSGAAPTAVLWILVLVVVVAVLAVFLASGGVGHAGGEERLAEPPPAAVGSEPEPSLSVAGPTRTGAPVATVIRPREGLPAPVDPAEVHSPERFLGAGTLRVHARVAAGTALPERWTLVLGPSKALIGGEHAERRRVERGSDDGLTVLEGVALGGYELRVESERMRSDPVHVMLARPGRTDRSVFLELSPAGYLIGQVADTAGLDVEGLELLLERADGAVSRRP